MATAEDFDQLDDNALVALNQQLGRQQDELRLQRIAINNLLKTRAAHRVLREAGINPGDAVVQGQVLVANVPEVIRG